MEQTEASNKKDELIDDHKGWFLFLYVLSIIFYIVTVLFYLLPLIYVLFSIFAYIIAIIMIVIPVVFTLFLILVSDDFRKWATDVWNFVEKIGDYNKDVPLLAKYFPYAMWPTLILICLVLSLSIYKRAKLHRGYIGFIVTSSIFLTTTIVIIVLFFYNGQRLAS